MSTSKAWCHTAIALVAIAAAFPVAAQRTAVRHDQLPIIDCVGTRCTYYYDTRGIVAPLSSSIEAAPVTPETVGPPGGQRYFWRAPDPICHSIADGNGVSSYNPDSPYPYIYVSGLSVPIGSTHVSLVANLESYLRRQDSSATDLGTVSVFGQLQIRAHGPGAWWNAASGYAHSTQGMVTPRNQFQSGHYHAVVDLSSLSGSGVPSAIDVRLAVSPNLTAPTPVSGSIINNVCKGQLQLTF